MAVISYSPIPVSIPIERRELLLSGNSRPETFQEYQYWIYNYMLKQPNTNLADPITQQMIVFAGGDITKNTMLGSIYYTINTTYSKAEPADWINMLKNIISKETNSI